MTEGATPLRSWLEVSEGSPFPLDNLPYGSGLVPGAVSPSIYAAIGDHALDLHAAAESGLFDDILPGAVEIFGAPVLNPFMATGPEVWHAVRERIRELLTRAAHRSTVTLVQRGDLALVMPFEVADYVDFYASEHHATNLGRMFRPDGEPLLPNWRHIPIGYHGRAGTVVVSGTPVARPQGQRKTPTDELPVFGPSVRLDMEAEVGFVVGVPTPMGTAVPVDDFEQHVFGAVLVNDWSARDIQAWEYQPLGPFLGKSFATSVSPWVVPLEALLAARTATPPQHPEPLPYLQGSRYGYDLQLEIALNGLVVSRPPFAGVYWTPAQQLAHMTSNGASLRTGDLYASGTVSGPAREQCGSFIELTWNGAEPLELPDGTRRIFLADGDTVTVTATAPSAGGGRLGFGEVTGTVTAGGRPMTAG